MIGKRKAKGRMGGGGGGREGGVGRKKYFAHSQMHFQGFPHSQFFKGKL